jgi:hypothetical protein
MRSLLICCFLFENFAKNSFIVVEDLGSWSEKPAYNSYFSDTRVNQVNCSTSVLPSSNGMFCYAVLKTK